MANRKYVRLGLSTGHVSLGFRIALLEIEINGSDRVGWGWGMLEELHILRCILVEGGVLVD